MAGEIPIRALLGSLGIDAPNQLILGPRIVAHKQFAQIITANTSLVFSLVAQNFSMQDADALLVELFSGTAQSAEASGKITLNSVFAMVADATAVSCADLPIIAPFNYTFPAHAGSPIGFFVQPPPPLRFKDMRDAAVAPSFGAVPTQPLRLQLTFTFTNSDAVDHQVTTTLGSAFRIISGVAP